MGRCVAGELGDLPGDLDPGRATPDDDEGQPGVAALRVLLELGGLERREDALADGGGALQRFDVVRILPPLVVSEIGVARAPGDDQRVIRERKVLVARLGPIDNDAASVQVKRSHLAHHHANVSLALEDAAQRRRDLLRSEGSSRDLIQQRLEEVEVATIDQRYLDQSAAKAADGLQTAKASAHDHDPVSLSGIHVPAFVSWTEWTHVLVPQADASR